MRRFMLLLSLALLVPTLVAVTPAAAWTWPTGGPVLLAFSFDPAHPYSAGEHRGIDIGGDPGSAVLAPAGGVVTFAGTVPGNGRTLTILTSDGWSVTLA
jgi:murein DD-endopeptidase MepM/ murein hydrolase activator NlpD